MKVIGNWLFEHRVANTGEWETTKANGNKMVHIVTLCRVVDVENPSSLVYNLVIGKHAWWFGKL